MGLLARPGSLGTVWDLCESSFVLQRFTRAGIYSEHLKQAIDLKMELELALKKYEELNIKPERGQRSRVSCGAELRGPRSLHSAVSAGRCHKLQKILSFSLLSSCGGGPSSVSPERGSTCSSGFGVLACPSAGLL